MINMDTKCILNPNNCKKCIAILNKHFKDNPTNAEIEIPTSIVKDSEEYFNYIFYSCLLDYGMKSKLYHHNLVNTYNNYPEVFNSNHVLQMNEVELLDIIKNSIHHRYPNVALKKWLYLSNCLSKYNSLKLTILELNSSEEIYNFIKNIKGYGQKTGGLLLRTIVESDVIPFKEVNSIPIDRHDMEICYLNGITNKSDLNENEIKELNDLLVIMCKENRVSPSEFDKYLWTIGNDFCNKNNCDICPLNQNCMKSNN